MAIPTNAPPKHLSAEAKRLWRDICAEYDLSDAAGLAILQTGLEARDRMAAAKKAIDADGMTVTGRDGQVKSHPLLPVERDSRAAWLAALKQLNLDLEPLRDRPGRPAGGFGGVARVG